MASCSDRAFEDANGNTPIGELTKKADVEVVNDMLVFSTQEAMYNYINSNVQPILNNAFISQKDLFNNIVDAEWEVYKSNEDSLTNRSHSSCYYQGLTDGLIREVFYSDGTQSYAPNLAEPFYNKIVNKEGFFAVGDTIYQITPTLIKKWIHGNMGNCAFLKSQIVTNEELDVYIIDITQQANDNGQNAPNTRAIFPIPNLLNISIGMYCNYPGNLRTTVYIKDQIKIINPNSYDRTLVYQISHQAVSGSVLYFVSKSYNMDVYFAFVDKNTPTESIPLALNQDNTGSCDYFYVWAPYMVLPGNQNVNYTDTYYYMHHMSFYIKDRDLSALSGYTNYYNFYGKRENYTSGKMIYDYGATTSDMPNYRWVEEIPAPF